ncbi:MAG: TIGR03557 family F420-dependent LLM class oxidoreductase [Chloroflexota bacterium]|nr:MAG: TIGR03557 family F420-dependent LLM class oxidoreductase [Chloroflexota bacterium]
MPLFGWKAAPEQYPPNELLDYAIAAEQAGFDVLEASDHFHPWSESGQAALVWPLLGAIAARTQHIRIGSGVTCPILRYNPAVIAQAVATLGAMAPGRVFLGVGTGEALNEFPITAQWPPYHERQERLAEAIDLIRALWTGAEVTFHGTYYQTRRAKLYTLPQEVIPIYISSMVPNSAAFAGRYGDGLFAAGGKEPPELRQMIQSFETGAREAGRDPSTMSRHVELRVAFTKDTTAAVESIRQYWASSFLPAMYNFGIYTSATAQENGKLVGDEIIRQQTLISDDPDVHVKRAEEMLDLGFDHIYFFCAGPDQRAFLEAYGKEVLPRLRQRAGERQHRRAA